MTPVCIDKNGMPLIIGYSQIDLKDGIPTVVVPVCLHPVRMWGKSFEPADIPAIQERRFDVVDAVLDGRPARVVRVKPDDDPSVLPGYEPSVFPWGSFPA